MPRSGEVGKAPRGPRRWRGPAKDPLEVIQQTELPGLPTGAATAVISAWCIILKWAMASAQIF